METTEPALWLPVGPQRPQKYHRKALDEPDKSVAGDRSRVGRRRHSAATAGGIWREGEIRGSGVVMSGARGWRVRASEAAQ